MSQAFTEKDIPIIKNKLFDILASIHDGKFDFTTFQSLGLISVEQTALIKKKISKEYPGIIFEPVPAELRPLLPIAQYLVKEERTLPKKIKIKPKAAKSHIYDSFDSWNSARWGDDPWSGPRYH